jgi:putative Mn2+ efflux pump MntP
MDLLTVIFLAIALAMDAFAVSVCKGLALRRCDLRSMLVVGIWFGGFQAFMPIIGFYLGSSFYDSISSYDHWIAFGLLLIIGLNMIREALSGTEDEVDADLGPKIMLVLALATSIDALAVGITFSMDGAEIFSSAAIIGLVTLALSMAGVKIGSMVGDRFKGKAEVLGGIILILVGTKILLEHLGLL